MDYQAIIENISQEIKPLQRQGKQADYIPALASVDPNQFGLSLRLLDGRHFETGNSDVRFSAQSITKVFSLALALGLIGDRYWDRVGKEPSGSAFNSLVQLEYEHGMPRNPFINAGAIVTADILLQSVSNPTQYFLNFVRDLCQSDSVNYNIDVAESEMATGHLNAAIAHLLKHHNNLQGNVDEVLRFYCQMCSLEMNCRELSQAFLSFANSSKPFTHNGIELTISQVKRMNALMQTCGFYDESGEFAYLVGLPGKSGVGGGIAAIYPSRYSIAVWSPRLNERGNSIMGMKALELFTSETSESIF